MQGQGQGQGLTSLGLLMYVMAQSCFVCFCLLCFNLFVFFHYPYC